MQIVSEEDNLYKKLNLIVWKNKKNTCTVDLSSAEFVPSMLSINKHKGVRVGTSNFRKARIKLSLPYPYIKP